MTSLLTLVPLIAFFFMPSQEMCVGVFFSLLFLLATVTSGLLLKELYINLHMDVCLAALSR